MRTFSNHDGLLRGKAPRWSGASKTAAGEGGSVLIIVMWIVAGVIGLALYFSHSMEMEMRASDNQVAAMQADQIIEGAAIYYSNVLASLGTTILAPPYMLPPTNVYQTAGVKVGEGMYWVLGRDTNDSSYSHRQPDPLFGLQDEAAKINLNSTLCNNTTNLINLPILYNNTGLGANIAAAIYDWSNTNTTPSSGGAKNETYSALNPPYSYKGTNYETVQELSMVYGLNLNTLYGEDANLNGALDPNENDGDNLPPTDNQDGNLDPGLLEWLTVYTHEPTNLNYWSGGTVISTTNRVLVSNLAALTSFLTTNLSAQESTIIRNLAGTAPTSVLDFANRSKISESDFISIEPLLMNSNTVGLINVNTATTAVLSCVPGIGYNYAPTLVSYRQANPGRLNSVYWVKDALSNAGTTAINQAGPYLTAHSFQFTADVAAVGHYGRGYRRVRFVFDCSTGIPQIVFRQDLTYLGWALGKKVHDTLLNGNIALR